MNKRQKSQSDSALRRQKSKQVKHRLIGRDVVFRGRVWRVVSANTGGNAQGSPWLTLRRGLGIEALAKSYELQEAAD